MTPEALSRITWTVDDRRAWLAAYADARRIERVRRARARKAADRFASLARQAEREQRTYDAERYSVRADRLLSLAQDSAREIEEASSGIQHDGIGWCVLSARGKTVSRHDTFEDAGLAFRGTL